MLFCHSVHTQGQSTSACRAGAQQIVFLERGPVYLVAISAAGEPVSALRLLLELLHAQLVCLLTQGFHATMEKHPRYDARRLLGASWHFLCRSSASRLAGVPLTHLAEAERGLPFLLLPQSLH